MKLIVLKTSLVYLVLCITSCKSVNSQSQNIDQTSTIEIKFNKNVELVGLTYFIGFEGVDIENKTIEINGKIMPKKEWHKYGYKIYKEYSSFATSNNLAAAFSIADHLWLDYIINFLLQVDDVPNAKLTDSINLNTYLNFSKDKNPEEALINAKLFLKHLNLFAQEINFDGYMEEAKTAQETAITEIKNVLPNSSFLNVMEQFYKRKFDHYVLIPSLTIPKGMGFGILNSSNNNSFTYNVFGAVDHQEIGTMNNYKMGFENQRKVHELSVHEFGHSFVNPIVKKAPDSLFTKTEYLFKPLKSAMENQGYNTWKICMYEHFVRAGEVFIALKLGNEQEAKELENDYIQNRKFVYIPIILKALKEYDSGKILTYPEVVEISMNRIKSANF